MSYTTHNPYYTESEMYRDEFRKERNKRRSLERELHEANTAIRDAGAKYRSLERDFAEARRIGQGQLDRLREQRNELRDENSQARELSRALENFMERESNTVRVRRPQPSWKVCR